MRESIQPMTSISSIGEQIGREGFCFVHAREAGDLLGDTITPNDWKSFADSWNDMPLDTYMADGGRYRRRRYATLSATGQELAVTIEPAQPHYQSTEYNRLNGGIPRHFAPVSAEILSGRVMATMLTFCGKVFGALTPNRTWHIEVHQFRIEANLAKNGLPTPEGVHRDGVDYVMVMMIKRENIAEGTTTIHDSSQKQLASFTLTDPLDLTLVDDHRCMHGVTPVTPLGSTQPAFRDVLVVTWRLKGSVES